MMDVHKEIIDWVRDTFGEDRDTSAILDHLWEEMDELLIAADNYSKHKTANNASDLLSEYADVQILLWNLMDNFGFCKNRLTDGVVLKHSINRKREWELKDGKMKHKETITGDFPKKTTTYYCAVCGEVPVDAEDGFDTCPDCAVKM